MQTVSTARTLGIGLRQVAAGKFDDLSQGSREDWHSSRRWQARA